MQKKKLDGLMKLHLFKNITDQSLYLIWYELAKERCASKGDKVCLMSKSSSFNIKRKQFKVDLKDILKKKVNDIPTLTQRTNEGIEELVRVYDTSKELSEKINNDLLKETEGLYIIMSGKCEIRNPNNNYLVDTIQPNDFFGECDFFEAIGYNYFGDIIAIEDCTFLYISKDKLKLIPEYDKQVIRKNSMKNKNRIQDLVFQSTKVYGGNPYLIKY